MPSKEHFEDAGSDQYRLMTFLPKRRSLAGRVWEHSELEIVGALNRRTILSKESLVGNLPGCAGSQRPATHECAECYNKNDYLHRAIPLTP